jgi:uncharacterized protein (DUF4415 family)
MISRAITSGGGMPFGTRGLDMSSKRTDQLPRSERRANSRRPSAARVDTSDIPPLGERFFANASGNPFYRPLKQSTTERLDADILVWLKAQGPGYQTRLNAILRTAMLRDGEGTAVSGTRKSRTRL